MATGSANPADGVYIRGTLRGGRVAEGRERPGGEGRYPDKYQLSLAVGDDTYRIEYPDEQAARDAVEASNPGATAGDTITLPVGHRAGARGGAEAFIFWFGRGERQESEVSW